MTAVSTNSAGILAVMVAYGTPLAESATLRSLSASLERTGALLDLFIYDNSPEPPAADPAAHGGHLRVTCHHDPTNPGVSAAFNAGARLAREQGNEWLLLLDQDTDFPPETMAVYLTAITSGKGEMFAPQLVAGDRLLSPCGYRAGIGFHLPRVTPGVLSLSGRTVLNSGLLVRLAAFEACGGYDEGVRVDFADFAFMNRFRRLWPEITLLELVCRHGFSNQECVEESVAFRRFVGYCRDGRAAAATPLLLFTHLFLVLRRCVVLTLRYRSPRFLAALPVWLFPDRGTPVP